LSEVNVIDWHVTPWRAERFFEIWEPAAERPRGLGAKSWELTRGVDDPLLFRQTTVWESRADFERYWYSDEVSATRTEAINYYCKPVLPAWHTRVASS
jgi:heme-degrading monooxygenase HmoA